MRCVCCRSPVDEEKACCPRCGFPLLGGNREDRRKIAGDYRKKLLGGTFLSIRQYYYGYDSNGDLQELKSEYVRAACAGELPPERISSIPISKNMSTVSAAPSRADAP